MPVCNLPQEFILTRGKGVRSGAGWGEGEGKRKGKRKAKGKRKQGKNMLPTQLLLKE